VLFQTFILKWQNAPAALSEDIQMHNGAAFPCGFFDLWQYVPVAQVA
jgi:hypothetical protein